MNFSILQKQLQLSIWYITKFEIYWCKIGDRINLLLKTECNRGSKNLLIIYIYIQILYLILTTSPVTASLILISNILLQILRIARHLQLGSQAWGRWVKELSQRIKNSQSNKGTKNPLILCFSFQKSRFTLLNWNPNINFYCCVLFPATNFNLRQTSTNLKIKANLAAEI